ncbi:MAG: Asp-tRNA(Asn)/Glu-tRNA(Gln) amidotransferase subunit GatC [Pseudomonadota bacterium]
MQIDEATVKRMARLARVRITDDEASALQGELNSILDWVEQLNEVNTEAVEAMTQVVPMEMKKRADGVSDGDKAEAVLSNAPMSEDGFFVVPKVVE